MTSDRLSDVGAVVIGRNEGERLVRCLQSLQGTCALVVYVDSNSTDGSAQRARALGAQVVELDLQVPFTAARARNAGFRALQSQAPDVEYVQFVDGDCEVVSGWIAQARGFLETHPHVGVVSGRRRERRPDASIYNLFCDREWDTSVGEARACGGDAMMRRQMLQKVGGFRDDLIAGEEPELCVRIRREGWTIWRLASEMTLHDAAIHRFGQWWRRSVRAGHAFAEGALIHGAPPERHWVSETRRAVTWGLFGPAFVLASLPLVGPWALALLSAYPLQWVRLMVRCPGPWRVRASQSALLVIGKFAEATGVVRFWWLRYRDIQAGLIEYK
jgi:GT2 family glycosyltransferase